jgi:membrane associated rhomboid family serine protease
MEAQDWQRTPPPGVTHLRIGDRLWALPDMMWEDWVKRGWVPPEAMVWSTYWTKGLWRRATTLETYHLFRAQTPAVPVPGQGDPEVAIPPGSEAAHAGLPQAIWGPGISVTQVLLLANLVVSGILVLAWKDDYSDRLWDLSRHLRTHLAAGWIPVLFIPLFLHATASHLLGNMVGLTAGGAAVEEFYGRLRTLILYLFSGLCGAGLSLLRTTDLLSVGASGAIMGMYGVVLVFLLGHRRHFPERQKIKTTRVYLPLLVLALLPSIFMADLYAHVGGFLGGVLGALVIKPPPGRLRWMRPGPHD